MKKMQLSHSLLPRRAIRRNGRYGIRILLIIFLFGMMAALLSACGGDPRTIQQATQSRAALDQTIQYAQNIGVPDTALTTVLVQEQTLNETHAPLALFNDGPVTEYYHNISVRYMHLKIQTQGIIQVTTEQLTQQAQDGLQRLQHTLSAKQNSGLPLATMSQQYEQDVARMQTARYPKDFKAISDQTRDAVATISMMPDTVAKLQTLSQVISAMQSGHQDVSTLQKDYDADKNALAQAMRPHDLQQVNQAVDTQNQQAISHFQQLIPLLTQAKLNELSTNVQQLQQYGMDTTSYQKRLDADRTLEPGVKTLQEYVAFAKQVDADLAAMHNDLLKGQVMALVKQFHQQVNDWGNAHQYYDKYNGQSYALDSAYMTKGIGEDLDRELNAATTADDYQQVLTDTQNALFHFQMFQQDSTDRTPFTQVHATDQKLLAHYNLQQSSVIVVSFIEEALRFYDHGQLVRSFLITAGRPELPPVPGLWAPLWRQTHTTFKSPYPPGSPYWYPDTPINYAILYHTGGYYLHDSWWRNDYGPGTQFYHIDSSGNVSANYGTHGCVNMPTDQAAWLYNNTTYSTQILMY